MIDFIKGVFAWFTGSGLAETMGAITGVITALIALFMVIPGEQPEKFLRGVLAFLERFSKK